jgi:hypothetical protein
MKRILLLAFLTTAVLTTMAQPAVKKLQATKITTAPKIDGSIDDEVWKTAAIATDFVELNPVAGKHETTEERTEIRIIYDNNAIYVGARMYETGPDKVARELVSRDNVGNSDFIGVVFDTYLDGINGSGFYVTAAGVQFDAKYSSGGNEDANWNAVWESKVRVDEHGWTAELKIPYSALRFPKKDVQTWGLNFIRKRQQLQKQLFWNELDPKKNGFLNQEGQLTGIENLTPPVRLAFYPYLSTYVNHYPYNTPGVKNTTSSLNGGMDFKYGINQSFTLDMTLIPDFGQVQSDNKVLNLTPFRIKYNENRPFFTEGTELFNKGNLFYSRNIGSQPIDYYNVPLNAHEEIVKNPSETRLLNATKVSGRMSNGLAIGVFNAVTQSEGATVQDTITGAERMVQTAPTTNYNILVLDQNLKNNSDIALINTNVTRFGEDHNADVGGFVFNLNNKKNSYGVTGYAFMSNLIFPDKSDITGYSYEVSASKNLGNFTWNVVEDFASANYNPNDLGFLNNPNYFDHAIYLQYTSYKATKHFTLRSIWSNIYYSRRYQPSEFQTADYALGANARLKNLWNIQSNIHWMPSGHDFYSPQISGMQYNSPGEERFNVSFNTNRAKRLSGGGFLQLRGVRNGQGGFTNTSEVFYNVRVNDHFGFSEDVTYSPEHHSIGFYTVDGSNTSVYSLYDRNTVENIFSVKYTFNNVMGVNLRIRHYWSKRNNSKFYNLKTDGSLTDRLTPDFGPANDENFNLVNTDMIYTWVFSPGSELSIAYKNSGFSDDNRANRDYTDNLNYAFKNPLNNNFSIKVLYYIDYQNLKKKKRS